MSESGVSESAMNDNAVNEIAVSERVQWVGGQCMIDCAMTSETINITTHPGRRAAFQVRPPSVQESARARHLEVDGESRQGPITVRPILRH